MVRELLDVRDVGGSDPIPFVDGEASFARDEHASSVVQLRKASIFAAVAWLAFAPVDWFIVEFVHPGRLWVYLLCRALGLLVLVPAALRLRMAPLPSPRVARFLETTITTTLVALITVTCIEFEGITSPLALGVVTVLVGRGALITDELRAAALPVALTALAHPIVLLSMAPFSPLISAQLSDVSAVSAFVLNLLFIGGAAAISLFAGHMVWSLRRQVFEARSLGRYKLLRRIGKGGMGEVWLAHHQALKRDVAIKILRPDKHVDDTAVARFHREAKATSELAHPNTVRVFDYGVTQDGLFYYAMELLEGEDLGAIVQRGPLRPERAVHLMLQAARALSEAHVMGLVHRDIKPENIYVTDIGGEEDFVKVLDFGLVKVATEDGHPELTRAGWAMGTPTYIAPEVCVGDRATARSDVYALGVVLYKLLCGRSPFHGVDARTLLKAKVASDPLPPSRRLGRSLPRHLERVVMRCLHRDPARRYAHAGELAQALADCQLELALPTFDDSSQWGVDATIVDDLPPTLVA